MTTMMKKLLLPAAIAAVVAGLLMAAPRAGATILSVDLTGFTYGGIDQNQAGINFGTAACAPTSAANSFIYLQDRYGVTGLVNTSSAAAESASVKCYRGGDGYRPGWHYSARYN